MIAFIIFGTKGVTYTKSRGRFFCPQCQGEQDYIHKRVRRFFELYFIPIIPLDLAGEYIHCVGCGGHFEMRVLSYDPDSGDEEAFHAFAEALTGALATMVEVEGADVAARARAAAETWSAIVGHDLPATELAEARAAIRSGSFDLEAALGEIGAGLADGGKEVLIKAQIAVASVAGEFGDRDFDVVARTATALGVSPAHLRGILAECSESEDERGSP